ncbi:MAG: hypothetical protein PHT16_00685 [Candidatus Pacebacteria bacterium]|nr:hypothetical protein [Candidatus Paceibacterota bacterium]
MSKRNFILLIIVVIIGIIALFGYFYFNPGTNTPGEDNTGTNFISQFNPFGKNTTKPPADTTTPIDISGDQPNTTSADIDAKLKKVSSMPIAGFTVFSKERLKDVTVPPLLSEEGAGGGDNSAPPRPSGSPPSKGGERTKPTPPQTEFMPALRYVERATGNIYQTFADKIEEKQFSTTMIPQVYEAFFGNKGNSVIMRYLKPDGRTIITFVGTLPKEVLGADSTVGNEIKGVFLPENTKDVSLSSDSKSLFYMFLSGKTQADGVTGATFNLLNNKKIQVFNSPFTEWLSSFLTSKMITFTTKPSAQIPGYMYVMDPTNKNYNFHKILGGINGLTTLISPNGKLALYSDNNLSLNIFHSNTKVSDTLGVKTLAEKCVWNKTSEVIYCGVPKSYGNGQYPDSWYQGEVSFSDQIWKIDVKTGNATMIADPADINGGEDIDSTKLALDDGENYLFFVNKKDSFLWELNLK